MRFGKKEVDLIVADRRETIFVEVKTRSSDQFGSPEESITKRKLRNLEQAIVYYIRQHPEVSRVRIDVVAIAPSPAGALKLKHFQSVGEGATLAFF